MEKVECSPSSSSVRRPATKNAFEAVVEAVGDRCLAIAFRICAMIANRRAVRHGRASGRPTRVLRATGRMDPAVARLQRKGFSHPNAVREFPHGRVDVVELDDTVVGRMTYEPGWRWSTHVKPIAATDYCQFHHIGVVLQGRLRLQMEDGTELEVGPGEVFEAPPGHDAWVVGDEPWVSVDFEAMRNYARPAEERHDRKLATIMFTDIVGSTARASALGAASWRELVAQHNERAERVVGRHGGSVVKTTGDGILASFDSAEGAVRGALAIRQAVAVLDLQIRAGIHTGEVEMLAGDVRGLAVHAAARLMGLAEPGDIMVSGTTRDLIDSGHFKFDDRGQHELRGLTGIRSVFAVANGD
jgi:class 3 adenylate cyclase/mannose-6-phosphate isomerase-like protein (cupin superfamily)